MLPSNPEAEQALIARLLLDPSQIPSVQLDPEDFYRDDMKAAYGAMVRLSQQRRPVDVMTVTEEAGLSLDLSVMDLTRFHTAPLGEYARVVRDKAFQRRYIEQLSALVNRARREDKPEVLVAALQERTAALAEGVEAADLMGRMSLEEFQDEPDEPLLGVLSPQGTTILYGDGGDGKGWVAARLMAQLTRKVAILDFEMQPKEWAYRLGKFGMSLDDVLYFSPPMTMDRWATEGTAQLLRAADVSYLVIDSAMYASDADDPYSPNNALAYGRARRRLDNLPALLLAHTTGNVDKVFGSVFWRNESRIVWRLSKDKLTRQRHMECRKANGYSWLEGRRYDLEFNEEQGILNLHERGHG